MNDSHVAGGRRRARLASILAALCCASALVAGLAPGPAGAQVLTLERLTDEQLGRLQKVALEKGSTIPLPAALVAVLRFSPAQVAPLVRQVSFQGDDGVKHGFAKLNDDSGYFLFRRAPGGLSAFHVDKAFKLLAAAHDFAGDRFIALAEKEGLDALNGEVVAWSRVLSPRGVSMPAPGTRPRPPAGSPPPAVPAPPQAPPQAPAAAPAPGQ